MSRISTVIIRLSDQDRDRPGMHCLPAMVPAFLKDQFELDVAIRIEDERGEMATESVPLSAAGVALASKLLDPQTADWKMALDESSPLQANGHQDDFVGLIGN